MGCNSSNCVLASTAYTAVESLESLDNVELTTKVYDSVRKEHDEEAIQANELSIAPTSVVIPSGSKTNVHQHVVEASSSVSLNSSLTVSVNIVMPSSINCSCSKNIKTKPCECFHIGHHDKRNNCSCSRASVNISSKSSCGCGGGKVISNPNASTYYNMPRACVAMLGDIYLNIVLINSSIITASTTTAPSMSSVYKFSSTDITNVYNGLLAAANRLSSFNKNCSFIYANADSVTPYEISIVPPTSPPSSSYGLFQYWLIPTMVALKPNSYTCCAITSTGKTEINDSNCIGASADYNDDTFQAVQTYTATIFVTSSLPNTLSDGSTIYGATFTYELNGSWYNSGCGTVFYNSSMTKDELSKVFEHEICHCFGAGEESYQCTTSTICGTNQVPNGNCYASNANQVSCVMRDNSDTTICNNTCGQLGWPWWNPSFVGEIDNSSSASYATALVETKSNYLYLFYNDSGVLKYSVSSSASSLTAFNAPVSPTITNVNVSKSVSVLVNPVDNVLYIFFTNNGTLGYLTATVYGNALSNVSGGNTISNITNVKSSPSCVMYSDICYVFYKNSSGKISYFVFGDSGNVKTINGGVSCKDTPSAIVFNDYLYVFYVDDNTNMNYLKTNNPTTESWGSSTPLSFKDSKSESTNVTTTSSSVISVCIYTTNIKTPNDTLLMFFNRTVTTSSNSDIEATTKNYMYYSCINSRFGTWSLCFPMGISGTAYFADKDIPCTFAGTNFVANNGKSNLTVIYKSTTSGTNFKYACMTNLLQTS